MLAFFLITFAQTPACLVLFPHFQRKYARSLSSLDSLKVRCRFKNFLSNLNQKCPRFSITLLQFWPLIELAELLLAKLLFMY